MLHIIVFHYGSIASSLRAAIYLDFQASFIYDFLYAKNKLEVSWMVFKNPLLLLSLSVFIAGCAANMSSDNEKVIATVGGKNITYGEFKTQYNQNSYERADTLSKAEDKAKFLNLLVDYHLKLLDAQKLHLMDDPAIKSEISSYEGQLATSYILENEITVPMVKEIYDRRKFEVRADQVFLPFQRDSLGREDTLKSYENALDVIKQLKAGVPVDSMLHKYRGGDTYYLTAGTFLQYPGGKEFEDLLYTLKPGEVASYPVRTTFGYLVVKLTDKRPRVESVRASHILIRIAGNSPADTLKAYNDAMAIMDSIKSGVAFDSLAMRNSADKYSAVKGGDLGYFARGQMVREFDNAAFNLKVGEIAGPVRTRFGYHIIKLTDIKQILPFSEEEESIRQSYLNGGFKVDKANFVKDVESKSGFAENNQNIWYMYSKLDTNKQFYQLDLDSLFSPAERAKAVFTFDQSSGTIDTIIGTIESDNTKGQLKASWSDLQSVVDQVAEDMVLAHYSLAKARTYPSFDSLITQYENGILIYHLEQQEIWNKVTTSDSVLMAYYKGHTEKYQWPRRVDFSEIFVTDDSSAKALYGMARDGANFDTLAAKYTKRRGYEKKCGDWGPVADSTNELAIKAFDAAQGTLLAPIRFEGGYSIVRVNKFLPAGPKTFDEARGDVSSDYQEMESKRIQNEWLESLRKDFGVSIDEKTFDELIAKE